MRSLLTVVIIGLAAQPSLAQTGCGAIKDPSTRLTCYDKNGSTSRTTTGMGTARSMMPARSEPSRIDMAIDSLTAGEDVVNARIKGICRGC